MKNKKGFTLVELLAVIVVLSIILVVATTSVYKYINDSKEKTRYMAAKEIVEIAEAYFAINPCIDDESECSVSIKDLKGYLEDDATNPETGKNDLFLNRNEEEQKVCKGGYLSNQQDDYSNNCETGYLFDGYAYSFKGNCNVSCDNSENES